MGHGVVRTNASLKLMGLNLNNCGIFSLSAGDNQLGAGERRGNTEGVCHSLNAGDLVIKLVGLYTYSVHRPTFGFLLSRCTKIPWCGNAKIAVNLQAGNGIWTTYTGSWGINYPPAYLRCTVTFEPFKILTQFFAPEVWINFLYVYLTENITWPPRHLWRRMTSLKMLKS